MKLYTVIPIRQPSGEELAPRYDLRPMNHMAVCNFMAACRNESTGYRIHEWPADIPHSGAPCFASRYKPCLGMNGDHFAEAVESRDYLDKLTRLASQDLRATRTRIAGLLGIPDRSAMGLTPDLVKAHPEWRAAKFKFDSLTRASREFNAGFIRHYKQRWKAELQRRRAANTLPG